MKQIEIPKPVLANIEWEPTEHPKYESRSREAYSYCSEKHPEDKTEPKGYIYQNATGNLYFCCHRCDYTVSVAQFADAVLF